MDASDFETYTSPSKVGRAFGKIKAAGMKFIQPAVEIFKELKKEMEQQEISEIINNPELFYENGLKEIFKREKFFLKHFVEPRYNGIKIHYGLVPRSNEDVHSVVILNDPERSDNPLNWFEKIEEVESAQYEIDIMPGDETFMEINEKILALQEKISNTYGDYVESY